MRFLLFLIFGIAVPTLATLGWREATGAQTPMCGISERFPQVNSVLVAGVNEKRIGFYAAFICKADIPSRGNWSMKVDGTEVRDDFVSSANYGSILGGIDASRLTAG